MVVAAFRGRGARLSQMCSMSTVLARPRVAARHGVSSKPAPVSSSASRRAAAAGGGGTPGIRALGARRRGPRRFRGDGGPGSTSRGARGALQKLPAAARGRASRRRRLRGHARARPRSRARRRLRGAVAPRRRSPCDERPTTCGGRGARVVFLGALVHARRRRAPSAATPVPGDRAPEARVVRGPRRPRANQRRRRRGAHPPARRAPARASEAPRQGGLRERNRRIREEKAPRARKIRQEAKRAAATPRPRRTPPHTPTHTQDSKDRESTNTHGGEGEEMSPRRAGGPASGPPARTWTARRTSTPPPVPPCARSGRPARSRGRSAGPRHDRPPAASP